MRPAPIARDAGQFEHACLCRQDFDVGYRKSLTRLNALQTEAKRYS
jgi:hypothetical protein